MGSLFSPPKPPAPVTVQPPVSTQNTASTPANPPPTQSDQAVEQGRQQELKQAAAMRGRQSTLLTGGFGDTSTPSMRRATLFGG